MVRSHFLSNVSRDPSLPKGRQTDDISEKDVKKILGDLPIERSQLIEALHLIQDEFNCLSQKHLKALSELFKISQAEVFEVASFYHHFDHSVMMVITQMIMIGLPPVLYGVDRLFIIILILSKVTKQPHLV